MRNIVFIGFLAIFACGSEYEQWLKNQTNNYTNYKKTIEEEFRDTLTKDWEAYKTSQLPTPYKKPKPKAPKEIEAPVALPIKTIKESPKVTLQPIEKPQVTIEKEQPIKKEVPKRDSKFDAVAINFYNQNIEVSIDKRYQFGITTISNITIAQAFTHLASLEMEPLLVELGEAKKKYQLNDWGLYLLVQKIAEQLYKEENKANLFGWVVFLEMGYDCKIGYSDRNIYFMASIKENLYQVPYFEADNKKYHILTPQGRLDHIGKIYTYESNYSDATKLLSFGIGKKPIRFETNITKKSIPFISNNMQYTLEARYSDDLIDLYRSFPQSEYGLYFDTELPAHTKESLGSSLKPLLLGKSEVEAVNILLHFVQQAFAYKTDHDHLGYEKVFFPEETLFYPYSDCEDRSILFGYLVKNLLGLDVVGVKFEDHLATGVAFSSVVDGDSFVTNNKRYTMCDPTYINANIGITMPQYKNKKFEVIHASDK